MGVGVSHITGYIVGCLASILLWKIERQKIFIMAHNIVEKLTQNSLWVQMIYIVFMVFLCSIVQCLDRNNLVNGIITFIVVDISNIERKNLNHKDKIHFYNSISAITTAVVCGFIGPLLYILILGNGVGLAYAILYNLYLLHELPVLKRIFLILTIIPSLIVEILMYSMYCIRYRRIVVDFKGDFLLNFFTRPLLNVDILAAYMESVNFYHYSREHKTEYMKNYGELHNKIDLVLIRDYLGISYMICFICFVLFFIGML